jgi:hypothetical protein
MRRLTCDFRSISSVYAEAMTKQIVILGKCGPTEDTKALGALMRSISETEPDELVLFEQSLRLLERLREVFDGSIGAHTGIADAGLAVTELPEVYDIAPGWVSSSRADYEASRIAGNTALRAAKTLSTCLVLGHTGRIGLGSYTFGYGGSAAETVTGMEVGDYQHGFGLLTVNGQHVKPHVVSL